MTRETMHIIVLFVLLLHVQETVSKMVQCYASFSLSDGKCGSILGEVSLKDCCMNPEYGYQDEKKECKSCRLASWTTWSQWSECSVTCTEGVRQRHRACYGTGICSDPHNLGEKQTEPCSDIDCCPENGAWSEWSSWQLCSVTCEKGVRKRIRTCTNPLPKCGGVCDGQGEDVENCDTRIICPTHGGWSSWGGWGACSGTCEIKGTLIPQQQRTRTCTNPPPSISPRGNNCPGSSTDTQQCTGLPFCPVNGNWGAWSAPSDCSVTCGVGLQKFYRDCDNPSPMYGGQHCSGDNTKISVCIVPKHCPANGQWTEWSEWTHCESSNQRSIKCKNRLGRRRRLRDCVGRQHEGAFCPEAGIDFSSCYDIEGCKAGADQQIPRALWSEWSDWSYCKPDCGEGSVQKRIRECIPDISKYRDNPSLESFSGKPDITCEPLEETSQTRPCINLPPC